jgi:hypothetical protein
VTYACADPNYFARVTADPEAGTITWPDGLDMAPEPLARGSPAQSGPSGDSTTLILSQGSSAP